MRTKYLLRSTMTQEHLEEFMLMSVAKRSWKNLTLKTSLLVWPEALVLLKIYVVVDFILIFFQFSTCCYKMLEN
ncbi:hypothetical protein HOLleu_11379 [Holothuria leucospilota]|uniref:Uncharacterized protein n=1 Tax=Holothuria leucospilota TaxID=206669 RepID=A0A9Q1CG72_HOLLE|nr:hypothetical protein HOLleu_11379 [Holothuria leucospilota]